MSSRWPSRTRPTITLLAPSSQRVAEEQWSCEEKVQNADGSIEYVDWWDFTGMDLFHEFITYFVRGYLRAIRRPDTTPRSCGSQFYRENPNAIDVEDVNEEDATILNPVPVDVSSEDDTPLANTPGRAAKRAKALEVCRPSRTTNPFSLTVCGAAWCYVERPWKSKRTRCASERDDSTEEMTFHPVRSCSSRSTTWTGPSWTTARPSALCCRRRRSLTGLQTRAASTRS